MLWKALGGFLCGLLALLATPTHAQVKPRPDSTITEEAAPDDSTDDADVTDADPAADSVRRKPARKLRMSRREISAKHKLKIHTTEPQLLFPNVNRIAFYRNAREWGKIRRAEKRHRYRKAYQRLRTYVGKFGIDNFKREYDLFWRLAQLCERVPHDTALAKAYYRLALKHRRRDLKKVQLYYDSLEEASTDLYVPLQRYYELVEYRKNVATFPTPKGINTVLGSEINSKYPDYGPTLNVTADLLIFSSKRKQTRIGLDTRPQEDLYYARKDGEFWLDALPFGKPINTLYNEGSACLSRDGRTLVFARCECPDCKQNCDLFISTLSEDSVWSVPKNLGPSVNSKAWDSQPALSPNADTIYFASDRLGGFGLSDIWFCTRQPNGEWRKAENLGPVVNTRESEVSPYFHPLYQVLYFSSRGQLLNFGDFDIYKTYRVGGSWQEPRNIGPLVNGKGSEYYFTIDAESKNLYYAKAKPQEPDNLDLYSFPLPMEAQPLAVTHLEGTLVDSVTNLPLKGLVTIVDLTNGIEVAAKYLREDGSFDFDLIDHARYTMLIQSPDFLTVRKDLNLETDTVMRVMTTLIDYKLPLIFQNLEFEPGKAEITRAMHPFLDRIGLFLTDHPDFKVEIAGHTDSEGEPQENLDLSQFRALAIRNYLIEQGKIGEARIKYEGFGSSMPLRIPEKTEEDRRINRRVEFKILKPEPGDAPAEGGAGEWKE